MEKENTVAKKPSNENERLFAQLCDMKSCLEKLIEDINIKKNQLNLIFMNNETKNDIDLVLNAAYNRYLKEIKMFLIFKDIERFRNSYSKCKNERSAIVAHLSHVEQDVNYEVGLLEGHLSLEINPKKYQIYKKRINDLKELLLNRPIKLVEECFNAEIYRPKHGDIFDKDKMFKTFTTSHEVIENLKELRNKKLGEYVDECSEYGAFDKETGDIIIGPAVCTYTIELAEKYKNFRFVK